MTSMKAGDRSPLGEVKEKLASLGLTLVCVLLCAAGIFYELERGAGKWEELRFHQAIYWASITISTVGGRAGGASVSWLNVHLVARCLSAAKMIAGLLLSPNQQCRVLVPGCVEACPWMVRRQAPACLQVGYGDYYPSTLGTQLLFMGLMLIFLTGEPHRDLQAAGHLPGGVSCYRLAVVNKHVITWHDAQVAAAPVWPPTAALRQSRLLCSPTTHPDTQPLHLTHTCALNPYPPPPPPPPPPAAAPCSPALPDFRSGGGLCQQQRLPEGQVLRQACLRPRGHHGPLQRQQRSQLPSGAVPLRPQLCPEAGGAAGEGPALQGAAHAVGQHRLPQQGGVRAGLGAG
jgi:hypothetical protein